MAKFIPILFSTPMVKAILEGRKTQTRRVVKFHGNRILKGELWEDEIRKPSIEPIIHDGNSCFSLFDNMHICPYGHPGDILWVRESFAYTQFAFDKSLIVGRNEYGVVGSEIYKADVGNDDWDGSWKPSIHMPKEACRIFLQVESIKVERLQDISEQDAINEGIKYPVAKSKIDGFVHPVFRVSGNKNAVDFMPENWKALNGDDLKKHLPRAHFAELWCDINGYESWQANPWVWVIQFKRIEKPSNFLQ